MLGTPQVTFSLDNPVAKAGMLLDQGDDVHIQSYPCGAAALDFGVGVELVSGLLVIAQGTGDPDANNFVGITVYKDAVEGPTAGASTPLPFQPGDQVPVLRKGRIAAQLHSGATVTLGGSAHLKHSSDGTHEQGLFTSEAVSGVAGSEISDVGAKWCKDLSLASATVPLGGVELNLP